MRIIYITLLCYLLMPDAAEAWGGGTHLLIGLDVLSRLHLLSPQLAWLLGTYPNDFLYGCLAADVVAHNYYVPYKIIRSFSTISLRHTYWELRFESFLEPRIWERARDVCRAGRPHDDALLRQVMAPTLFSFGNSKRIFNSIMLLSRLERWQLLIKAVATNSQHRLTEEDRQEYLEVTIQIVMDMLINGEKSYCWQADPTGESALEVANDIRSYLRFLYKSGRFSREEGMERVEFIKPTMKRSIQNPELLTILKGACHESSLPFVVQQHHNPIKNQV